MKILSWITVIVFAWLSLQVIIDKFSKENYYNKIVPDSEIVVTADNEETPDSLNIVFHGDGSIYWLKVLIKRNLIYPEDFRHVKTQWEQINVHAIRVYMTYATRSNATNMIQADVQLTGKTPVPQDIDNLKFINIQKSDYK